MSWYKEDPQVAEAHCSIKERMPRLRHVAETNNRRLAEFLFAELMSVCKYLASRWGFQITAG